jgi:hypothetical protein
MGRSFHYANAVGSTTQLLSELMRTGLAIMHMVEPGYQAARITEREQI